MCWQFGIVALVAIGMPPLAAIGSDAFDIQSASSLLTWICILSAAGVSLTRTRFVDLTAAEIKRVSRAMSQRDQPARFLMVQLIIVSIGCLILALRPPPEILVEFCQRLGGTPVLAPMTWTGILSVLAAGFGATGQAAARAANPAA